jgi:hypothetical protein
MLFLLSAHYCPQMCCAALRWNFSPSAPPPLVQAYLHFTTFMTATTLYSTTLYSTTLYSTFYAPLPRFYQVHPPENDFTQSYW